MTDRPNIQRHSGGKVPRATTTGMPYCTPNGQPTRRSGVVYHSGPRDYRAVAYSVDCARCLKNA